MTDYDAWKTTTPEADEQHDLRMERFHDYALGVAKQVMDSWDRDGVLIVPADEDSDECREEVDGPLLNYYCWWLGDRQTEDDESNRLEFRFMAAADAVDYLAYNGRDVTENW